MCIKMNEDMAMFIQGGGFGIIVCMISAVFTRPQFVCNSSKEITQQVEYLLRRLSTNHCIKFLL